MIKFKFIICLSLIVLITSSCRRSINFVNRTDSVENWKIPALRHYNEIHFENLVSDYMNNRFREVGGNENNEIEIGYREVAKMVIFRMSYNNFYNINNISFEYFNNNVVGNSLITQYLSDNNKANLESNPNVWWKNVIKIIGDFSSLRDELLNHVKTENQEIFEEAGHIGYNVIFDLDGEMYVMCTILKKTDGQSEVLWGEKDKYLINILQYWNDEN